MIRTLPAVLAAFCLCSSVSRALELDDEDKKAIEESRARRADALLTADERALRDAKMAFQAAYFDIADCEMKLALCEFDRGHLPPDKLDQLQERIDALKKKIKITKPILASARADITAAWDKLDRKSSVIKTAEPKSPAPKIAVPRPEISIKTFELANGSTINARRFMKVNDSYTVTLLNGEIYKLQIDLVKDVSDNHMLYQQYLRRPANLQIERDEYQKLMKEKQQATAEKASLDDQLQQQQKYRAALREELDRKSSNEALNAWVETKASIQTLEGSLKNVEKKVQDADIKITAAREAQIYFALCDGIDFHDALAALDAAPKKTEAVRKPNTAVPSATTDADRQKRMEEVLQREREARQKLIDQQGK